MMVGNSFKSLVMCLAFMLLCVGCASKRLTTSVQDQEFARGRTAVSIAPATPPKFEAPKTAPSETGKEIPAAPKPFEEVRITEPPAPPPTPPLSKEQGVLTPPVVSPSQATPAGKLAEVLADVFFDYDRFSFRDDARAVLETNARLLKADNGGRLVIEGHCDERGTLEYNLVLGERRAHAAKEYLTDLGLPGSQIQITSFGKEKPFCSEHSQKCWQQNRRAHFAIR
jgi:peptidoglycan-associated lipoprotein